MKTTKRRQDPELRNFIRAVLKSKDYTREKWAEMLEITPRSIDFYLKGERKPSQKVLLRMIKLAEFPSKNIPF